MKKLILTLLLIFLFIGCKAKTSPYKEEVNFLKSYYKKGKISKTQYIELRSRIKQKTSPQ
ncbi:MAG: hypothetical protein KKH93_03035 [Candidatus Omnitrophica bacterium]|nr:hypothetical protein [Candidatus Omnitrophota bacterium]MBU2045062.1 hypothetical protein [Candidatus Omnitrophota bacterium]MBU2251099.1 hypothetical protein [Candidatus Omnitrophota bacterium]MBU2266344.1 hypothetical protein [Candidatus Omnitrophota bacterium]MBU2473201.1 hypothetical protein [Candidatus Omnitrophota bacterium]